MYRRLPEYREVSHLPFTVIRASLNLRLGDPEPANLTDRWRQMLYWQRVLGPAPEPERSTPPAQPIRPPLSAAKNSLKAKPHKP